MNSKLINKRKKPSPIAISITHDGDETSYQSNSKDTKQIIAVLEDTIAALKEGMIQ